MRLLPYIVGLLISIGGIVAGVVMLSRKETRAATLVFIGTAAVATAVIKLWHP